MLTTLDQIIERLVAGYQPDRIVLFGSRARGEEKTDSDFDLLVVKDTAERPIERRMAVERLLADRRVPVDVLVYTPREIWELYAAGSPLVESVVASGRVLYMRRATAAWVAEAQDELESGLILMERGKYRAASLHSQQAAEKALKALLLERGKRPPRTHDLIDLLNAVREEGWQLRLETDEAIFLNSIYRGRYPTEEGLLPYGEPSQSDAARAIAAAQFVVHQLKTLLSP
jgi:HEPN domain-containing protein/predicted nucleotidyltransferase